MKKIFASFSYAVGQIGLGLLLHPYQTMQSLVEEKVFIWMTLFPMGVLAVITMGWRFAVVPAVRLVFSCSTSGLIACDTLPFISNWLTFFCLYWQILLLYLFFRFSSVFKRTA
jgi:hypothetical protein